MSGVATAIGGGALISAYMGNQAANKAAGAQEDAANISSQTQMNMFNTEQANEQPYMQAGSDALTQLNGQMSTLNQPFTMSQFQEDPGYQFNLSQGLGAVQSSAAAQGHMLSSGELGNASNYAQSMASNEFGNAYNRYMNTNQQTYNKLMGLVQVGQAGASNTNAAAMNTANNVSANQTAAGNASAAGTIGSANAISGGIGQATSGLTNYSMFNSLMNPNKTTTPDSGIGSIGAGGSSGAPSYGGYNTLGAADMNSILAGG